MDMTEYQNLADSCRDLLNKNTTWINIYKGYIDKLNAAQRTIKESQTRFSVPAPLKLYLPLSSATGCSDSSITYDLRYLGQSVGSLKVYMEEEAKVAKKDVFLEINEKSQVLKRDGCLYKQYTAASEDELNWHTGDAAKAFRKTFQDAEFQKIDLGCHEHRLESYLLTNYAKKSSDGKELLYIQPVGMCGTAARFQMPTPFRASELHKLENWDNLDIYAKNRRSGGGIDILARTGSGHATYLTIIELKDENSASEPPHKAIGQAIAYSVFIRELLRCDKAGNADWWKFFGFSCDIPKKLVLRAVIAMPFEGKGKGVRKKEAEDYAVQFMNDIDTLKPKIKLGGDEIELHYIFRNTTMTSL